MAQSCWELLHLRLTCTKLCTMFDTPNNMQQGVQMDPITCTIKQRWEFLTYKVVSVCTVLNVKSQQIWVHSKVHSALLESYNIP